jgi:hypothetical protein
MMMHVVFGLFFALAIVTAVRGAWLYAHARRIMTDVEPAQLAVPVGLVTSERKQ